jgi:hypothetical protein
MNKTRHIGALLTCGLAAAGMATVGLSAPAVASYGGPRPTSNWLRPVEANTSTWVAIGWQTSSRICDVEVRVEGGRRVDVDYQGHRSFTRLSHGDSLSRYRRDYSAVRVNPNFGRNGVAPLRATIEYDNCDRHARTQHRSYWLALPVRGGHHSNVGHGPVGHENSGGYGSTSPENNGGYGSNNHENHGSLPTAVKPTEAPTGAAVKPTATPTDNTTRPGSNSSSGGGRPHTTPTPA